MSDVVMVDLRCSRCGVRWTIAAVIGEGQIIECPGCGRNTEVELDADEWQFGLVLPEMQKAPLRRLQSAV